MLHFCSGCNTTVFFSHSCKHTVYKYQDQVSSYSYGKYISLVSVNINLNRNSLVLKIYCLHVLFIRKINDILTVH